MRIRLESESKSESYGAGVLISGSHPVRTANRIGSVTQTRKAAVLELIEHRSDLSVKDLIQNRRQRLRIRIVIRINVIGRNGVARSIPVSGIDTRHRILVEEVQDIEFKGRRVMLLEFVIMSQRKVSLRIGRGSSKIAAL